MSAYHEEMLEYLRVAREREARAAWCEAHGYSPNGCEAIDGDVATYEHCKHEDCPDKKPGWEHAHMVAR